MAHHEFNFGPTLAGGPQVPPRSVGEVLARALRTDIGKSKNKPEVEIDLQEICAILFGRLAAPVFADSISISFTNSGITSGNLNSGVMSVASNLSFDGTVI